MRSIRRILEAVKDPAESLLDQLPCDVLIVKPAHFAPRVQRRHRGVQLAALGAGM